MQILFCLLLILSLHAQAAAADEGTRLDAQVQSLRMDYLEHVAAVASEATAGQKTERSELEGLFARYRSGRIDANAVARLTLQLIAVGLPQGANTVLTSHPGKRLLLNIQESLWFEVVAAWYARGRPMEARAALEQIPLLRHGMRVERLRAKIAIQAGERDVALKYLGVLARRKQATPLDRYNLAALSLAATPSSRSKEAIDILSDLAGSNDRDVAMKNLAALTAGRALLQAKDYRMAIRMLKQVGRDSVHAPEAHYNLAKAYMATQQSRKAIGLWEELARRAPTDPYSERAMMALPSALGALDATGEAVTRITAIQKRLEGAITELSGALNELADPSWIDRVSLPLGQNQLSARELSTIPAAPYILDQIATHHFQTALINAQALRELRRRDLPNDLMRRVERLSTAQKTAITAMLRPQIERRLAMLEQDLLATRFEYAVLLDNQARQTK